MSNSDVKKKYNNIIIPAVWNRAVQQKFVPETETECNLALDLLMELVCNQITVNQPEILT